VHLAREILARLQEEDPQRSVEVVLPESMEADCDPRLMRILLENLLRNAWKFSSKVHSPRIEITCARRLDAGLEITIRDNGVGFPMDRADKLFSPFHRMHGPEEFPGTGIGLAIVQRIAVRHGGGVRAESQPGQGAAFTVSLPGSQEGP
jgi:signal transduction histidine kinase